MGKSKSFNWLILPSYSDQIYPKHVEDLAKSAGVEPKLIAERDGVEMGVYFDIAMRRDEVEAIIEIMSDPHSPQMTMIEFEDGEIRMINLPIQKLVNKLDDFLCMDPDYCPNPKETEIHFQLAQEGFDPNQLKNETDM